MSQNMHIVSNTRPPRLLDEDLHDVHRRRPRISEAVASSSIVVSTAAHEFFGISIVEALYLGCIPVLPRELSYPEILPEKFHSSCLYRDFGELREMLEGFLRERPEGLAEEDSRNRPIERGFGAAVCGTMPGDPDHSAGDHGYRTPLRGCTCRCRATD